MKNIIKGSVLVAFLFLAAGLNQSYAQASVGLDIGIPLGDFGDAANVGFGASFRYDKAIQDKLSWTATAGYQRFGLKDQGLSGLSGSFGIIPIMGGIKYYFQEADKGIYGGADLGLVFVSYSADYAGNSFSSSETRFGFNPGLGYRAGAFDVAVRYNVISDFNNFGFRLAYVFVK